MTYLSNFSKPVSIIILSIFIATQVFVVASILLMPKPAKAIFGFGDTTIVLTQLGNVYDILKDIGRGVMYGFALSFINKYLTKFINKVVEKYKIRNFLYYDQILSNYYLTNFLRDKVHDPDLLKIYNLLNAAYITGQSTGLANQPGAGTVNFGLIPQIKAAIAQQYKKVGGLPDDYTLSKTASLTEIEKWQGSFIRSTQNPSYTEAHLRGQYGGYQSAATTAAQLEIIVGSGLKAGRLLGGTCDLDGSPLNSQNTATPQGCAAAGGQWNASTLDQARSFIDNPSKFVSDHLTSAIDQIFKANLNPEAGFWTQIGAHLGSFLFNRLLLNSNQGTPLIEDPRLYQPDAGSASNGVGIDIDGDNITDAYDINGDGQADICVYGGDHDPVGPPCKGSFAATHPPESVDGDGSCTGTGLHGNDPGAPSSIPNISDVVFDQGDNVQNWAETGILSSVFADDNIIQVNYDKASTWPPSMLGTAETVGNPWVIVWRSGSWHAVTFSWLRPNQTDKDVGEFFCGGIGGAVTMGNFQPVVGETYMFMVSCVARDMFLNNCHERTNIAPYTWPSGIAPRSFEK